MRRDRGITFLIVEHDLDFVMQAADRVVVMNEGRVLTSGTPAEVRANEQVVDAYLGTAALSPPLLAGRRISRPATTTP